MLELFLNIFTPPYWIYLGRQICRTEDLSPRTFSIRHTNILYVQRLGLNLCLFMTRFYHKKTQAWANNSTSPCYTTKTRRFRNYLCMNLWKSRPSCTTRVRVKYLYTFTTSLNIILGRKLFGHLFFQFSVLFSHFSVLSFLLIQSSGFGLMTLSQHV